MSKENHVNCTLLWKYLLHHFLLDSQTERTRKPVLEERPVYGTCPTNNNVILSPKK